METPEVLAGQPVPPQPAKLAAAALPPVARESSTLVAALSDSETGLPADTNFSTAPYKAGLSLTAIGQPSLVAGTSEFGTYVGGGLSLFWSDELGNRNLITGLQVNGGLKDITGVVAYQNVGETRSALNNALAERQAASVRAQQYEAAAARASEAADKTARQAAALAARIQESEAGIAAARAQLAIVTQQRELLSARLALRQKPVVRLTAALERFSRRPLALCQCVRRLRGYLLRGDLRCGDRHRGDRRRGIVRH